MLRGTGIRVKTMAAAAKSWGMSPAEIADQYDISERLVNEALAFYEAHREEIDASIAADEAMEATAMKTRSAEKGARTKDE